MNISKSGIELIKRFEGLRLKAYQDSVGIWTIGYGWTQPVDGKKVGPGMQIDQATADCSGQLKLATALEFFQYRFSDS
ncbi:lysozyme, partial [Serratia marcescens]|uniref:lysozyme n=5 Tax=Serratia TaxID=613 RepID=UPI003C786028